jgi:hypothetical protein
MKMPNPLKKLQNKYYGPGSPLRYVRKATLELSNPGASRERARVGAALSAQLPASLAQRAAELEATGYADAGEELDGGLLAELDQTASGRLSNGYAGTKIRSFFTKYTDDTDLNSDSIFVRFALQPAVQKLVCSYFGNQVPYLAEIALILSHSNDKDQWTDSQLWHLDHSDARTVLLWVYLTDVNTSEEGPFTYLPVEASRKYKNSFFPKRVADESMVAAGLAGEARQVYGPRLKAFYVDTARCYHLGSRLKGAAQRFVYLATFITHKPLYPLDNGIKLGSKVSEAERLLLRL